MADPFEEYGGLAGYIASQTERAKTIFDTGVDPLGGASFDAVMADLQRVGADTASILASFGLVSAHSPVIPPGPAVPWYLSQPTAAVPAAGNELLYTTGSSGGIVDRIGNTITTVTGGVGEAGRGVVDAVKNIGPTLAGLIGMAGDGLLIVVALVVVGGFLLVNVRR